MASCVSQVPSRSKAPGVCGVTLVGALAQILAFTQQQTTAASGGDGDTFLMVAGARYPLYRNKWLLLNFR
jgi:hypothetical protein